MRNSKTYFIVLFSILFFLENKPVLSQDQTELNDRLSRYRFSLGVIDLLIKDSDFKFNHTFFNWSFRSSGFDKSSSSIKVKFAFEPGLNGLILSKKTLNDGTDFSLYFVPYAKFGPEIRLSKNFFLGASAGLIAIVYDRFIPLPFFGINNFYLIPLNESLNIEIESGFHSTFSPEKLPLLFYFSAGISF